MTFSSFDHECMAMALRLARKGLFTTDPNPRVGCVIADNHTVAGAGWHSRAGGPHAEIAALQDAGGSVRGMTAYVTLEPCSHHGRTPPCTRALIEAGVARVVVASTDPNPSVSGTGLQELREAGVKVETGLMTTDAEDLNAGFFCRMKAGRPWVRIKSAISLDGRSALKNGQSQWISGEDARRDVQFWRARSSAILTGIGTVLADDPRMTVRVDVEAKQPVRVIVDGNWRTPPGSRILSGPGEVLIAGDGETPVPPALESSGATCLGLPAIDGRVDLGALLCLLAEREINEVQVEAGARLCGALLTADLVDEILIYQAPILLGDGGPGPFAIGPLETMADRTHFTVLETLHIGNDMRVRLQPSCRH